MTCAGRSETIWDRYSHAGRVQGQATGDVACDAYHKTQDDLNLLKDLGVGPSVLDCDPFVSSLCFIDVSFLCLFVS